MNIASKKANDKILQECIQKGIGFHSAGMGNFYVKQNNQMFRIRR